MERLEKVLGFMTRQNVRGGWIRAASWVYCLARSRPALPCMEDDTAYLSIWWDPPSRYVFG
jgi:hypothetical protein